MLVPMFFQHLGFTLGDVDDSSVFLLGEVGACHLAFTEVAYRGVVDKVVCLGESEVVWADVVVVVHYDPSVFPDALPAVGCFMAGSDSVVVVVVHGVGAGDGCCCCVLDGCSAFVRYIVQVVGAVVIHDIAVNDIVSSFGSSE